MSKIFATVGLTALIACFFFVELAEAQVPVSRTDQEMAVVHEKLDGFFETVASGETQKAFEELLAGTLLVPHPESILAMIQKTDEIPKTFGEYRGYERVLSRRIGKDCVVLVYLYKCADHPAIWYVTLYRAPLKATSGSIAPRGVWRVINIQFDSDLEKLLPIL